MTLGSGVVNLGDFEGHFGDLWGALYVTLESGVVNLGHLGGHFVDLGGSLCDHRGALCWLWGHSG